MVRRSSRWRGGCGCFLPKGETKNEEATISLLYGMCWHRSHHGLRNEQSPGKIRKDQKGVQDGAIKRSYVLWCVLSQL